MKIVVRKVGFLTTISYLYSTIISMTETAEKPTKASEKSEQTREFYKTLIVSQSGKGKTYSFRNVDPNTFAMVNIENKPLPFKNNFKYHARPTTRKEAFDMIFEFAKNPEIKAIGIDSFSAYTDLLLAEARAGYEGWDVWNYYNTQLALFFALIKKIKKEVFLTAHYETLPIEGSSEKRTKVKGKEWEGVCEKEFTVVLWGDSKFNEQDKPEYFFDLAKENTSAKCPPAIFGEGVYRVPNDVQVVLEKIIAFAS